MKTLLLIRHGKSDWQAGLSDKERPLNKRGRHDAERVGQILAQEPMADYYFVSTAMRTTETFHLLNESFKTDDKQCVMCPELYLCSADTLLDTIHFAPDHADTIAIIGHNPGLSDLASHFSHQSYIDMPPLAVYRCIFDTNKWENINISNMISHHFISPKTI